MTRGAFLTLLALLLGSAVLIGRWQAAALLETQARLARERLRQAAGAAGTAEPGASAPEPRPSLELLRLRGQVGVLRRQLAELDPAEEARRQHSNDWHLVYSGPRPSDEPDFRHFASLQDVGSATPAAALESFYYAMNNQGKEPLTDARMKDLWDVPDDFDQEPGYNLHMGEGLYGGAGYRIVRQEVLSSNTVSVTIDYEKADGSSYRRDKILVQTHGRWRMKPARVSRAGDGN